MAELDIRTLPADALALLQDPRLKGMEDPPPGTPNVERLLTPANPALVGESPFLLLRQLFETSGGRVKWVNKPDPEALSQTGEGNGLAAFRHRRPRLEQSVAKPKKQFSDLWSYLSWFVASPKIVEILSRFGVAAIDTVDIEWVFSDGSKLDGYVFMDVCRRIHAYDYQRTAVVIAKNFGKTYIERLAYPRALHPIPDDVHIFRDAFYRDDVFVSRALAKKLVAARAAQIYFEDPAAIGEVRFD